jgi:dynein heavy chain 1
MRMLADDDDDNIATTGPSKGSGSQQPAWMRVLYERCKDWLGQLPGVRSLWGYPRQILMR